MIKNNIVALLSQTVAGIFVLISSILFMFGSPYSRRSTPFGVGEILFAISVFFIFTFIFLYIGTKLEFQGKRIKNLLSISAPIFLCLLVFVVGYIFIRVGPSILTFVVFTFTFNYSYPLVAVFHAQGSIVFVITSILPIIFMYIGLEAKNRTRSFVDGTEEKYFIEN